MKEYAILGALGHLIVKAKTKEEAEKIFSKQFDLNKYPVNLYKR
jgi:hypothetical protein